MAQTTIRTPSSSEIVAGIAAGKRERSAALWAVFSGFVALVRQHFVWRENMQRMALSNRCPDCSC
ncbi:hypothetical protein NUH88_06780 [Nisaea acidiphila]|uniref:Uncharacterized protein n=1 Tax=Nisaea acidiphila TaxID=1862145 RepID=A0A9J7AX80_9PROT|nr:hypothetical protein [Nisaea acidiphila]UUX51394.1 hypothetical protein NUH88_06780 [Nisaea acidiphila]